MTNTKSTKRALLLSALAIVMSVAMLIGSTFAWFTDSASTAVNTIQSGKLDVALEYSLDGVNWSDAEGQTLSFKKAAGAPANEAVLWEPGCTYELPLIRVRNNGNLALKYEISVIGATGDLELFDVISFTAAIDGAAEVPLSTFTGHLDAKDASSQILLKGHMDEDAGNEYQDLAIESIAINVLATQYTYEYDSNDNQYDKDAVFAAKDANDLKNLFAKGGNIKLVKDITTTETLEVPAGVTVNLDLNGKTITGTKGRDADNNRIHVIVNNGILTIKDGTVKSAGNDGGSAIYNNAGANLTIEDVTLYGAPQSDPVYEAGVSKPYPSYAVNNYGNAVVNGATVKSYHGAIATGGDGVTVINDADIDVGLGQSTGITSYAIYSYENAQVTVNDGKFAFTKQEIYVNGGNTFCELGTNPILINGGNYIGTSFSTGAGREYVIKGGTFDKDPTAYVANSYQVVDNGDGTYTVLPKVVGAELTYYADGLYSDANSSKNYYVASGAGMDTIAEKINDGTLAKNTNITLLTDIDLTDVDYAPISGNKGDSWYTGTFDGQNHTITGMTVNAYEGGLIGSSNGTVKNVIIDGATVTGSYHAAGIVGTGYGSIQNCTVKNSAIIGNYAGALRGYSASGTNTGNTVENCTINGKYAAGGLFGLVTADGTNTISDNTVKNCDIYCEVPAGNSYNGIGEVVGRSASDKVVIENNMTENVTLH